MERPKGIELVSPFVSTIIAAAYKITSLGLSHACTQLFKLTYVLLLHPSLDPSGI